jgi:hypothetical protein
MMPRLVFATLVAVFLAIPGAARSEPSNYDECILDAMKGVSSDVAARAIIESCRRLYPDTPEEAPAAAAAAGAAAGAAASQAAPASESSAPEAAAPASASQPAPAQSASGAAAVATVPQSVPPAPDPALRAGSSSGNIRELSNEELDKLEYRGTFLGTTYLVKVTNGNESLRLTEVTIAVWDQDDIDRLETYRTEVDILPLDEGTAKYTVVYDGQEETWDWKLVGAKGAQ